MDLTISRDSLNDALAQVKRVAPKRTHIPILANVLIEAGEGLVSLRTTDCDMHSRVTLNCETRVGGTATLPAHILADMVKATPKGGEIALQAIDGALLKTRFTAGRASASLDGLSPDDFPVFKYGDWTHTFSVSAPEFKHMLETVQFAISTEETRYYLNGVFLHIVGDELRMVATDGHRLAKITRPFSGHGGDNGIIVPRLCIAELVKMIGRAKGELSVSLNAKYIEFGLGGSTLTSKTIDGTFPDYQRIIPSGNDKRLVVDKASFVAGIKSAIVLSSERGRTVKLTASDANGTPGGNGSLTFSVKNPDSGETKNTIDALRWDSDDSNFEIGFNAVYLLDCASHVEGDTVTFRFDDPRSPTLIGGSDSAALIVLMPSRV